MTEYDHEPIRGLPGYLPAGETILWQGAPDWRTLARTAYHTRLVAGYFALLTGWAGASAFTTHGGYLGLEMTIALGALAVVLLHLLAWAAARSTVYTLTDRRIVLRIGIAVPKCVNLPLGMIGSVDLATRANGTGDVPLEIAGPAKLGILALWPHARPWTFVRPRPMLRAIPEAQAVAALIADSCRAAQHQAPAAIAKPQTQRAPSFADAVAA
ncbi:photosynthetic complex putative assembly protein PuhB [Sphingomonas sp. BIUV-7]|uniref:Photosynthetic complex putative assembly protein PuhB n=1 Tax=Sphingomonas natans TaxID=3063330 RepID=A0ABT8YD08_9SPHN|nr:photosynthetic complex putative assembly protein PuhB [Sphingomonas sp. BIUV-7]MDO6416223.1 photosynthetic complex putative assembly protein PuhB [Sphingomonas sp. BIUV-7]